MTDAPNDRKLARVARDLAWGNWATKTERAMLLGPRGEVREMFTPGDATFLATRERMLRSNELSAVVYLRALAIDDVLQASLVEFFGPDGERSTHVLFTRNEGQHWLGVPAATTDQWIDKFSKRGGNKDEN